MCDILRSVVSANVVPKTTRNVSESFEKERPNDKERSERPSLASDDVVKKIEQLIPEGHRMKSNKIHENCADVSRTVLRDIILNQLNNRKLRSR